MQEDELRTRSNDTDSAPRGSRHPTRPVELGRKVSSASVGSSGIGSPLEVPPRSGGSLPPPPRPPDYQTAVGRTLKSGRKTRVSRTQSREGGEAESGGNGEDETQVSAV